MIHDVRAFVGLSGYYRKFIKHYAEKVAPLTELLQLDTEKKWLQKHTDAVNAIKAALTEAPALALPDYSHPFIVYTDASSFAIGAQLMQNINDVERPIAFISRKLHGAETRYSTYDKEMLAILYAIDKWQVYLSDKEFVIYSDHRPLQYLLTQKTLNARQQRWLAQLNNYKFTVKYIDGKKNIVPDALSRCPDYEQTFLCALISEVTGNGIVKEILKEYKKCDGFIEKEYVRKKLVRSKEGLCLLSPWKNKYRCI